MSPWLQVAPLVGVALVIGAVALGRPDGVTISTDTAANGLIVWSGDTLAAASDEADSEKWWVPHVPALADLDPCDDTRLPQHLPRDGGEREPVDQPRTPGVDRG